MRRDPKLPIPDRNRQILQMRQEGVQRIEVARRFKLSPSRIEKIEKQDTRDRAAAVRRAKLRDSIRSADDPNKPWAVNDLLDAIGLPVVTKNALIKCFLAHGKWWVSLRELMDLAPAAPTEWPNLMMSPLLGVRGIGKKGFWHVVNGLTDMNLGIQCSREWQERLTKVKGHYQQ